MLCVAVSLTPPGAPPPPAAAAGGGGGVGGGRARQGVTPAQRQQARQQPPPGLQEREQERRQAAKSQPQPGQARRQGGGAGRLGEQAGTVGSAGARRPARRARPQPYGRPTLGTQGRQGSVMQGPWLPSPGARAVPSRRGGLAARCPLLGARAAPGQPCCRHKARPLLLLRCCACPAPFRYSAARLHVRAALEEPTHRDAGCLLPASTWVGQLDSMRSTNLRQQRARAGPARVQRRARLGCVARAASPTSVATKVRISMPQTSWHCLTGQRAQPVGVIRLAWITRMALDPHRAPPPSPHPPARTPAGLRVGDVVTDEADAQQNGAG